ncbi:MAG: hypothetical protein FWE16_04120 [Firmicutes bacterium]|nr:hypothetical protein [Bacillota bacterium]
MAIDGEWIGDTAFGIFNDGRSHGDFFGTESFQPNKNEANSSFVSTEPVTAQVQDQPSKKVGKIAAGIAIAGGVSLLAKLIIGKLSSKEK